MTTNQPTSNQGDLVTYKAVVRVTSPPKLHSEDLTRSAAWKSALIRREPRGTVTFKVGNTRLCSSLLTRERHEHVVYSKAKCKSAEVPFGKHQVIALYSGDDYFRPSQAATTATVSARAVPLDTGTTVTVDPPASVQGDLVTYLATVRPKSREVKAIPTGTVTFTAGKKGTPLCTAAVPLNGVGNAKCRSTRMPADTSTVTVTYSGGVGFNPSVGATTGRFLGDDIRSYRR